jgi:hypothetical protein
MPCGMHPARVEMNLQKRLMPWGHTASGHSAYLTQGPYGTLLQISTTNMAGHHPLKLTRPHALCIVRYNN